jgi:hypothetical protein
MPNTKRTPGRPQGSAFPRIIRAHLPGELYREIQAVARLQGLTASTWVRVSCMKALADYKKSQGAVERP